MRGTTRRGGSCRRSAPSSRGRRRLPRAPHGGPPRLVTRLAGGDDDARGEALDVPLERPGADSSKSLRSNTSRRSGLAKMPKFARCASPHRRTSSVRGRRGQVVRHHQRRATEEGERRRRHPRVAQRHEILSAGAVRLDEHLDRVEAVARRLPRHRVRCGARRSAEPSQRPPLVRRRDGCVERRQRDGVLRSLRHGTAFHVGRVFDASYPSDSDVHVPAREVCRAP